MIETLEDAKKYVDECDGWPPITSNPRVNFLIDQAMGLGQDVGWEDIKEEYKSEVKFALESDDVNVVDPENIRDYEHDSDVVLERPGHWCKAFRIWGTCKVVEIEKIPERGDSPEFQHILNYKLGVTVKRKMDHAGVILTLDTPSNEYSFTFYDTRHWNSEKGEWETHEGGC